MAPMPLPERRRPSLPASPLMARRLLDSLPARTAVLDREGRVVLVNRAWRRFDANGSSGRKAGVGVDYVEVWSRAGAADATAEAVALGLRRALAEGVELALDYPCHAPTEERWFTLRATRFVLDRRAWLLVAHEDVTSLRKARRVKDEFIATVRHELRTPLTAILSAMAMVEGGRRGATADAPAVQNLLEIAGRNARRLLALVNDLLDAQRLGLAGPLLERRRIDLGMLVDTAVGAERPRAAACGVTLRLAARPDRPLPVQADPDRLHQVLGTLLGNAVRVSRPGDAVEVALEAGPDSVLLRVEDHGPGVPHALRHRLFARLSAAEHGAARHGDGTGLGLSLARTIVEAHGGAMGFDGPAEARRPLLAEAAAGLGPTGRVRRGRLRCRCPSATTAAELSRHGGGTLSGGSPGVGSDSPAPGGGAFRRRRPIVGCLSRSSSRSRSRRAASPGPRGSRGWRGRTPRHAGRPPRRRCPGHPTARAAGRSSARAASRSGARRGRADTRAA